jgi:hypothetical protein
MEMEREYGMMIVPLNKPMVRIVKQTKVLSPILFIVLD